MLEVPELVPLRGVRLGAAPLVGGPHPQHVVARFRGPAELPPHPGARYLGGAQLGRPPGAVVDAVLDRGDRDLPGERPPADHLRLRPQPGRPGQLGQRGNRLGGDRRPAGRAVGRITGTDQHIVLGVPRHVQVRLADLDPGQPLDAGRPEPARHHHPGREPMIGGKDLPVHGQRDEGVIGQRLPQRHRPAGPDLIQRLGHDLPRPRRKAGLLKQVTQPDPGPLGRADRPASPLGALEGGAELIAEQHPAVARALDGADHGNHREPVPQLVVAVADRPAHPGALDPKRPVGHVHQGSGRVAADVEPVVGHEKAGHPIGPGAVVQPGPGVLHQLRRCRLDDLAHACTLPRWGRC